MLLLTTQIYLQMKKITFMLFALIAGTTFAQSADATAAVNAAIVSPITISNTGASALDFGNLASPSAATDIVVSTAGVRTAVSGVTIPGTTSTAAAFSVVAENGYSYSVSIPDIVLTGTGGADMAVTFAHDAGATPAGTGSAQAINVGGTLTVNANQVATSYTGTATVTVAYE